jgi:hypothetical protein
MACGIFVVDLSGCILYTCIASYKTAFVDVIWLLPATRAMLPFNFFFLLAKCFISTQVSAGEPCYFRHGRITHQHAGDVQSGKSVFLHSCLRYNVFQKRKSTMDLVLQRSEIFIRIHKLRRLHCKKIVFSQKLSVSNWKMFGFKNI